MEKNPFISFLGGFIVCTIFIGIIYFLAALATFNLAGGETLKEMEGQRVGWFVLAIFLTGASVYLAITQIKRQKKFTGYGILSVALIALVIVTISFSKNFTYTAFDKQTWAASGYKPYNMAVTLVKRNTLSGLTKKQVLDLLGQPDNDYQDKSSVFSNISYRVKDEWTLTIYFKNDQFEEAGLRLPMMMTIHRPLRMIHTV